MSLVVSGGHTELVYMEAEGEFQIIGETRDDAVGEAYDKVARTLGLPYPGGPHIDKLAMNAVESVDLPRAWLEADSFDFSFSGLKSAVINKGDSPLLSRFHWDSLSLGRACCTGDILRYG